MRICHYSPVAPPQLGGIETFLTTLTRRMPSDRFVILAATGDGAQEPQSQGNCDIVRYPTTLLSRFENPVAARIVHLYDEAMRRRWLARRRRSLDLVHVHSLSAIRHYGRITSRLPWRALRRIVHWYANFNGLGIPVLYTDHSHFIGNYARFLRSCGDVLLDHMAHVVCVDESGYRNAARYVKERGLSTDLRLLPNAVDTDLFRYEPPDNREFFVGFVGRVEKEGLDLFARLVLEERDLRFKACLAGDASRLPKELGTAPNLDIVWRVPNDLMPSFYRSIGVLFDPFSPGVPRTSVEAMACGRPVVRIREESELESLLVSPETSPYHSREEMDAMVDTIHRLKDDPVWYRNLCESSRRTVETTFSISAIAAGYKAIYEGLLSD